MTQVQIEAVERNIAKEIEDLRNELSERLDENDFLYGVRLRDGDFRLDEIKDYVKEMIEKAIEKHAADGFGTIDYAAAAGGGTVVKHSQPYHLGNNNWFIQNGIHVFAQRILQPSFGEPGQCLPLKGNSGYVEIKLRQAIVPEAITLEHVAKSVAHDRSMAPKECRVFGWLHPNSEKMVLLREFTYDLEKSNVQTFNVWEKGYAVNMIRFEFT